MGRKNKLEFILFLGDFGVSLEGESKKSMRNLRNGEVGEIVDKDIFDKI